MNDPRTHAGDEIGFLVSCTRTPDGIYLIAVRGHFDLAGVQTFRDEVDRLRELGAVRVVVDLLETGFIDSTGLGALLYGLRALRAEGGELRIASAGNRIGRIFRITGLDRVFPIFPSLDAALEASLQPAESTD
jgi:anti-sigma B factor antagonist